MISELEYHAQGYTRNATPVSAALGCVLAFAPHPDKYCSQAQHLAFEIQGKLLVSLLAFITGHHRGPARILQGLLDKFILFPRFSLLLELWIKCYHGFKGGEKKRTAKKKKSQSLVAVCSRGSAHFPVHTAQCAESRACLGRSTSPLLLHQSCSFCIAQWHRGAWWGGEMHD